MKEIIQKIVNHGLVSEDDFHEKRKIQISNFMLVFAFILNLINLLVFTAFLWRPLLVWDAGLSILFVFVIFILKQKRLRVFFRHFVCIALTLGLANLSVRYGERPGFHFFMLFLGCIPFFLFEKKGIIFAYVFCIICVYVAFDFFFSKNPLTPDLELSFMYYPQYDFVFFGILIHHL